MSYILWQNPSIDSLVILIFFLLWSHPLPVHHGLYHRTWARCLSSSLLLIGVIFYSLLYMTTDVVFSGLLSEKFHVWILKITLLLSTKIKIRGNLLKKWRDLRMKGTNKHGNNWYVLTVRDASLNQKRINVYEHTVTMAKYILSKS